MDAIEQAKDFIKMARSDLEVVMESSVPYSICFHAQQCAEKYLKAYLAYYNVTIPRSHDMNSLIESCSQIDSSLQSLSEEGKLLQSYAVNIRYTASKEKAERECPFVWKAMNTIYDTIREKLPPPLLVEDPV